MKLSKEQVIIAIGWVVFMILFWFLGKPHQMSPVTAFFGVGLLTAVYAGLCVVVKHLLKK
jgi:hypothetical protein